MKTSLIIILLLLFTTISAQTSKHVEKGLWKANLLAPGFSYELGMGRNSTLNFEIALIPIAEGELGEEFILELFPTIGAEFRYFTNMKRRLEKGKHISGNSGNYISFLNQAFIAAPLLGNIEYDTPIAYLGAFTYGFQRTYNKGFYFSLAGGPGFFTGDNDPIATLYLDARIGWVIGGRKR